MLGVPSMLIARPRRATCMCSQHAASWAACLRAIRALLGAESRSFCRVPPQDDLPVQDILFLDLQPQSPTVPRG